LNEMIAKEKGVKVADLQKDPDAKVEAPKAKATTKADAKETATKK
jgi:hypothetical protein